MSFAPYIPSTGMCVICFTVGMYLNLLQLPAKLSGAFATGMYRYTPVQPKAYTLLRM